MDLSRLRLDAGQHSPDTAVLGKLIEAVFQVPTADELYVCVAEFVPLILSVDHVSVSVYLQDEQRLSVKRIYGDLGLAELNQPNQIFDIGKSYSRYREIVRESRVWNPTDDTFAEHTGFCPAQSVSAISVPLWVAGQLIGTLNIGSKNTGYQPDDLLMVRHVTTLVGVSLERINRFETEVATARRSRLYAEHLELLNILGEKLSLTTTITDALQEASDFAKRLVGATRVSYCELEPCKTMIRIIGLIGSTSDTAGQVISLEKSGLGDVLLKGERRYNSNLKHSHSPSQRSLGEGGLLHLWSFPIISAGVTKGALNIGSPDVVLDIDDATSVLFTLSRLLGSTLQRVDAQAETLRVMAEVERQARTDALTGLPNRNEFRRRLDNRLRQSIEDQRPCAVLFFDLDLFKNINDTLGHAIGDELLRAVSRRVETELGPADTVARIGGDEFLVLLPEVSSEMQVRDTAQRIVNSIAEPLLVAKRELAIGASVGAACYPDDGLTFEDLIKNADIAMYVAKESGRNQYQMFDGKLSEEVNRRVRLEGLLHAAIKNNEFTLSFQPQYDCITHEAIAVEALIRWYHPEEGTIPPDVFIPVAERCGVINKITDWVLKNSLSVIAEMRVHYPHIRVAVNVSASEFSGIGDLYNRVHQALQESGLPPQALELELTETALLDHPEHAGELIEQLNDMGVQLAIDDFGTGYASLSYLVQLPIHTIKIDRSFVDELETDTRKQSVISGIIGIANGISVSCVGEGVETIEQYKWLAAQGCQFVQGYLICRPVGAERLIDSLNNLNELASAA